MQIYSKLNIRVCFGCYQLPCVLFRIRNKNIFSPRNPILSLTTLCLAQIGCHHMLSLNCLSYLYRTKRVILIFSLEFFDCWVMGFLFLVEHIIELQFSWCFNLYELVAIFGSIRNLKKYYVYLRYVKSKNPILSLYRVILKYSQSIENFAPFSHIYGGVYHEYERKEHHFSSTPRIPKNFPSISSYGVKFEVSTYSLH